MSLGHPLTFTYNNLYNTNLVTQKNTFELLRAQEYEARCHWNIDMLDASNF